MCVCVSLSVVSNSVTPWTVAHQAPLSMEFTGHNPGVGCHSLLQEGRQDPPDLPNPGIEPRSSALLADSLPPESPVVRYVIRTLSQ